METGDIKPVIWLVYYLMELYCTKAERMNSIRSVAIELNLQRLVRRHRKLKESAGHIP